MYRVDNTDLKISAMDMPEQKDPSFDVSGTNMSFVHTTAGSQEKLVKIFRLSERVNNEIEHLFTDARNLPTSLRLKMPELLNFMDNFRQILINRAFIPTKPWEKREVKGTTKMIASFLHNVLRDNSLIIEKHHELM